MIEFLKKIADWIYPGDVTCYVCGEERREGQTGKVCPACRERMEPAKEKRFSLNGNAGYACFRYDGQARKIVLQTKDSGKSYLTQVMADLMVETIEKESVTFDVVAYVPTSGKKTTKRGYDHMKLTAGYLAERTGKPVLKGLLRIKEKADQTEVTEEERKTNVKDAFVYTGEKLTGKTVLLLDDVISTGSTLTACTTALQLARPGSIIYLVFTK